MSELLTRFFTEWYEWATQQKVVDTRNFHRDAGLCSALTSWASWNQFDTVGLHSELVSMLEHDFKGNYQFPFDKNPANYWLAKTQARHHKNAQRLAWVKKKLGML